MYKIEGAKRKNAMVDSGHLLSSRSTRPNLAIDTTSSHHPKDRTLSLVRSFALFTLLLLKLYSRVLVVPTGS